MCCFSVAGCLKNVKKEPYFLLREFDINSRVTLVRKTLLLHHSAIGVSTSVILKSMLPSNCERGKKGATPKLNQLVMADGHSFSE
jgi:hypothetical protein